MDDAATGGRLEYIMAELIKGMMLVINGYLMSGPAVLYVCVCVCVCERVCVSVCVRERVSICKYVLIYVKW